MSSAGLSRDTSRGPSASNAATRSEGRVDQAPHGRRFLDVRDVCKYYGAIRAVDGVSFSVGPGEIVGVIGPNGSGKTTLFNSILGQIKPSSGAVEFCGEDITGMSPLELARRGVGRTFQTLQVFTQLSVRDNLIAAAQEFRGSMPGRLFGKPDAGLGAQADAMIELFRLTHVAHLPAGRLSYGQQKLVELAQVLMLDPKLILLDEPAGGINPTLIERLVEKIRELNAMGKTFLIVEHNMPFVLGLCDPVHVLGRGRTMASGTPEQIRTDPAVIDAYLGDDFVVEEAQ